MPDNDKEPCIECQFKELAVASFFMSNGMLCVKTDEEESYMRIDTVRERVKMMSINDANYPIKGKIQPVDVAPSIIRKKKEADDAPPEDAQEGNEQPSTGST